MPFNPRNLCMFTARVIIKIKEKIKYLEKAIDEEFLLITMMDQGRNWHEIHQQAETLFRILTKVGYCQISLRLAWEELEALLENRPELIQTREYRVAERVQELGVQALSLSLRSV